MIRTVLGDIENENSGNILMHEHIQCISNDMKVAFGDKWLDESKLEDYAVRVLKSIKEKFDVGIFVDGTGIDMGRNAALFQRISEKSGVNIIASTGLYYYPSMLTCQRSAEELAEIFLYECENGLDGTNALPGILKCAADGNITDDTVKRLEAVAITQAKTGLPMYVHCSHNDNIAFEMMHILAGQNVNPEKTVFGHASRRLNPEYLSNILNEGYYICIDQSFTGNEKAAAQTVYTLCEKGYENKLLFSHDRPLYNDFESSDRTGIGYPHDAHIERFSFLYNCLIPEFKKLGISNKICEKFLNSNARDVLNYE